jgi:hypothetical protein
MGSKPKKIRLIIAMIAALLMMLMWSMQDTIVILWAASRHPKIPKEALVYVEPARTEFKRQEQKYFLGYGIYVPLEDMMYIEQLSNAKARYAEALAKSCSGLRSDSGFAIWLPLKSKWPLMGERVMEWCWRPPVQRAEAAG